MVIGTELAKQFKICRGSIKIGVSQQKVNNMEVTQEQEIKLGRGVHGKISKVVGHGSSALTAYVLPRMSYGIISSP